MKKIYTMFIMIVLILSIIPTVFSEQNTNADISGASSGTTSSDNIVDTSNEASDVNTSEPSSAVPVGVIQRRNLQAQQVAVANQPVAASVSVRLNRCVTFVTNNNLSDTPALVCRRVLEKEADCIQFMKNSNVENPWQVCDHIFNGTVLIARSYLRTAVSEKIADYRLKIVDKIVEKNSTVSDFIKSLSDENAKKFMYLTRAQQKKILEMRNTDALKLMNAYKLQKVKVENLYKKRVIAQNKLLQAEQRFKQAVNKYLEAQKRYEYNKSLFLEAKNRYQECKDKDTEECQQLQENIIEHAKDFLADRVNMIIEYLNKIREKVEGADDIPEDEANEIIADIDAAIEEFNAMLDKISAAETKEDIQAIAREINDLWKRMNVHAKRFAARLIHAKVGEIIERSEHLEEKLDCALAAMEEQGIEVTAIETNVDLFSQRIDEARTKFKEAQELFQQAKDLRDLSDKDIKAIQSLIDQAKLLVREAHEALKQAHILLVQIVKDIRAAGGKITDCVETDVDLADDEVYEVVEEDEEEEETEVNSFEDCVNAGYPVMESYPRQCTTPSGETFVEEIEEDEETDEQQNSTTTE